MRYRLTFMTTLVLLLAGSALPPLARAEAEAGPYEEPPVREALEVLPEWMVNGEYWTVADPVISYDSLHEFNVRSEWGDFEVYGEPMLRIRLKELSAIGALKEQTLTKVAGYAAKEGATKAVKDTVEVVSHPIKTAKALPRGIVRMFKKIGYDVGEVGGDVVDVGTHRVPQVSGSYFPSSVAPSSGFSSTASTVWS